MYANHSPAWDLFIFLVVNHDHCISTEKQENRLKKRFLYGFSMGGTVVLQLHRKDPLYWDGAVLLAPMCKVRSLNVDLSLLCLYWHEHLITGTAQSIIFVNVYSKHRCDDRNIVVH
jgi:alpha-beta hydrolase superfamily lysophospholipase